MLSHGAKVLRCVGKIVIEKTGQSATVVNKLSPSEEINEREYGVVAGGTSFGLLPVVYENKKKTRALVCTAVAMIPLRSYFSGIVTQKMFTDTVNRLISMVKSCEESGLNPRNLSLSLDHIFVEPRTKELKCILWPLSGNQNAGSPEEFFRELPYSLVFNKHEDCAYVSDYIQFFRAATESFSLQGFEQFFSAPAPEPRPEAGQTPSAASEPPYDPLQRMIEQKAGAGLRNVCPNCGITNAMGAKICVACGAALIAQDNMSTELKSGTGVLGYSSGSTDIESEESPYPYLIRESTNQIISVDKPGFHIGKDKNTSDFCVTDNSAISRSHAVIHTRDDRYFIVDQNSTNKTYIDGRAIPPNQEVEIFPGAKIKLANEEFVFYI